VLFGIIKFFNLVNLVVVVTESLGKYVKNAFEEAEVYENLIEINVAALKIHVAANEYMSDEKSILSAKADTVCEVKFSVLAASAGERVNEKSDEFETVDALVASTGGSDKEKYRD
jgi:hypothetical protein